MVKYRKSQAALEYLTTYGWAILAAMIAVGALAYFGFLNPANLLPNKCDFGKQLECTEYKINSSNAQVYLMLRNNFGKPINITAVGGESVIGAPAGVLPLVIAAGAERELRLTLNSNPPAGDKLEVNPVITFKRSGGTTLHNITGTVFVIVQ